MVIVIPAYQPDTRVLNLIDDIQQKSNFEILLVNDGSSERCKHIFDQAIEKGCTVLTHELNMGKGAALKTAFHYLWKINFQDGFVCADCDGQHSWEDIKKLAESVSFYPCSIILGCRKFVGNVPMKSRLGNTITKIIFSMISGTKITDTQTGLRGFSHTMLPWLLQLEGNRYEYEMNQLLEAKKSGYGFHCIPINTIYEHNNTGSHFRPIADSFRIFLPILKFSISSITCGAIDFGLLFLLNGIMDHLLYAVVITRIISSLCNYLMNKYLVFHTNHSKKTTSFLQYFILAAVILGCNYILLSFLHVTAGIPLLLSKLLTEGILFLISFHVQNKVIFKKTHIIRWNCNSDYE